MSTYEELQSQFDDYKETSSLIEEELQKEIVELTRQNEVLNKKLGNITEKYNNVELKLLNKDKNDDNNIKSIYLELNDLKELNNNYKLNNNKLENKLDSNNELLRSLECNNNKLIEQIDKLQEDQICLKLEHEEKESLYSDQIHQLEEELLLIKKDKKITSSNSNSEELENLKEEYEQLDLKYNEQLALNESLASEIDEVSTDLFNKSDEVNNLQKQLVELKNQVSNKNEVIVFANFIIYLD